MIRSALLQATAFCSVLALAGLAGMGPAWSQSQPKPAQGQAKPTPAKPAPAKPAPAKATAAKPAGGKPAAPAAAGAGQPVQLATFGDWGAYASDTAKGKVCYALAQPKDRLPKSLSRDPGYLFIATRPGEGVRNEVSVVLGFPAKEGGDGKATIGQTTFQLVTKGTTAWVKNAAEDAAFVEAMKRGQTMTVEATSRKGNVSTDRYALGGIGQALDRVRRECP